MSGNKRDDKLGREEEFQSQSTPQGDDLEARSLGEQGTFSGGRSPQGDRSLGDQITFGSRTDRGDDAFDDGMEVVDLSARYKIEKTLGKGGMGEVLLATDTRLGRKVAIKRILGEAARSHTAINRFLIEAKSIAALNHPNIVQIYDYGRAIEGPFLIMEFVDGESLLDRTRAGALPLEEAVELTCQLCDGLALAHAAGIIHRDIKPANILINRLGIPKLTDFGLAKAESGDTGMTLAGAVLGTLDFMPPEQRRDAALTDARSDLWSLAATLYQIITGESPKVIRLRKVPVQLQDLLDKGLEESKANRYQSAREFKQALREAAKPSKASAAQLSADLVAGECPACHTGNEANWKFCRECAAPLRCECLNCQHEIPVWDKVCRECGGKQAELAAKLIAELSQKRERAEQLHAEFHFDQALALAAELARVKDQKLSVHRDWAEQFIEATQREKVRQLDLARSHFEEAKKHHSTLDYGAAIRSIAGIPRPFRSAEISSFLLGLESLRKESIGLLDTIKFRLDRNREPDELLPLLTKAVVLQGVREPLTSLLAPLREQAEQLSANFEFAPAIRLAEAIGEVKDPELSEYKSWAEAFLRATKQEQSSQLEAADQKFEEAKRHRAAFNYEAAIHVIKAIPPRLRSTAAGAFLMQLEAERSESEKLLEAIVVRIENHELDELLPLMEKALVLRGDREDLRDLAAQLKAQEQEQSRERDEVFQRAESLLSAGQAHEALQAVGSISPNHLTSAQHMLRIRLEQISVAEVELRGMIRQAKADGLSDAAEIVALLPKLLAYTRLNPGNQTFSHLRDDLLERVGSVPFQMLRSLPGDYVAQLPESIQVKVLPLTNSIGLQLLLLPAGTFTMGDPGMLSAMSHQVTLTRSFYLGLYQVTQEQYLRVMGYNPSRFKQPRNPVDSVSWKDAVEFCRKLSELPEEKAARREYRLPTEAEWEYACRAGSTTEYCFGDDESQLEEYAWFGRNSGNQAHPVGEKKPNAWGLYDMHGNVCEWCSDWYRDYPQGAVSDPVGPKKGFFQKLAPTTFRVFRGGSWFCGAEDCRSSERSCGGPGDRGSRGGFRVALNFSAITK